MTLPKARTRSLKTTRHEKTEADNVVLDSTLLSEPCQEVSVSLQLNTSILLRAIAIFMASWLAYFTTESEFCQVFAVSATLTIDITMKQDTMTEAYLGVHAEMTLPKARTRSLKTTRHEKTEADNVVLDSTLLSERVILRRSQHLVFK